MRIEFRKIYLLLLIALSAVSCSYALVSESDVDKKGHHRIVLSGIVVDTDNNEPLEDIKICFTVYSSDNSKAPVLEKNVYTDNKGIYYIDVEMLPEKVRCTISAFSLDSRYISSTQDINVLWSGPSYDQNSGTFFVNDCNFQLLKAE